MIYTSTPNQRHNLKTVYVDNGKENCPCGWEMSKAYRERIELVGLVIHDKQFGDLQANVYCWVKFPPSVLDPKLDREYLEGRDPALG